MQTDNSLAAAVGEQHVIAIQSAALKVAQDCRWVNAQRRVTVTLNAEQEAVNYPDSCGPGSVLGMAIYLQNRYIPLTQAILPLYLDTDQELIVGGETLLSVEGMPRYFEQRAQLHLLPRTDQEYKLRIEYMALMNLPLDDSVSIVDAQLIVYAAASMISKQQENVAGAEYYATLYADRLGALKSWQSAGTTFALSSEADLNENEMDLVDCPNWNRLPTPPRP